MRQQLMSFDTHEQVKNFQKAGFKIDQAEVIVHAINTSREFDLSRLATKEQLQHAEEKLTAKIDNLKTELHGAIKDSTTTILKWIITLMISMFGVFIGVILKVLAH